MRTLRDRVGAAAPVFGVLLVLLVAIAVVNPSFLEPASLLAYLKRAAPLAILAVGQYFVIVSGEFDLSVGSLVTVQVVVAARLIDGDESATAAGDRAARRAGPADRARQRADHDAAARAVVRHHARHAARALRRGVPVDGRRPARVALRRRSACPGGRASTSPGSARCRGRR